MQVYNFAIDIMRDPRDAYQIAFCSRYSSESGQQHFKPLVIRPPEGIAAIEALVPTRTYVTVNGPTDQLVEEEKWWQLEPVQERPSSWNLDTKYQYVTPVTFSFSDLVCSIANSPLDSASVIAPLEAL